LASRRTLLGVHILGMVVFSFLQEHGDQRRQHGARWAKVAQFYPHCYVDTIIRQFLFVWEDQVVRLACD
jgi:hypothetical protein